MADEECNKKLEDLQKYIPFLKTMISQLQDPNKEREKQLNKIVSLLSMITEKKKLKIDTLNKCEEVILQLLNRVKHKPNHQTSSNEVSSSKSTSLSPPRDATTSKEIISKPFLKDRVYDGHFARKPSVFERLGSKMLSPVKRPIISFQDLNLLQDDVKELYSERRASYVPKTKFSFHSELAFLKEKIEAKKESSDGDKVIDKAFTITKSVTTVYEHRRSELEEENYSKLKPKSISSSTRNDKIRYDRSPSKDRYWWKYERRRSVSLDREKDDGDKRPWRKERRSDDYRRDSRERSYSRDERKYERRSTSREKRSWSNDRRRGRSSSKEKIDKGERRKYDRSVSRERNEDRDRRFSKDVMRYRRSISRDKEDKDRRSLKDERGYRRSVSRERTGDKDRRYTTSERKYDYPRIEYPKRRSDYSPNRNRSYKDYKKEERRSKSREKYKNEPRSIAFADKRDHVKKEESKDLKQKTNDANHKDSSKNNNALPDMLKKVDNNSVAAESVYDLILDEVRKEVVPSPQKSSAESASNSVLVTPYSPVDSNSDMDISSDDDTEKTTSSLTPITTQNVPLPFPFPSHPISTISYPKSSTSTQVTRVVTNRTLTVITTTDVFNQFGKASTPSPNAGIISTPSSSQQSLAIEAAPQSSPKLISPTPSEPPPILSPQCERPSKQLNERQQESRYLEYKYRSPASSPLSRHSTNVREYSSSERTYPNEEDRDSGLRDRSRSRSRSRSVSPGRCRWRPKVKRLRSMTPDSCSESPDRRGNSPGSASPERETDDENRKELTPDASEKKVETSDDNKSVENEDVTKTDHQVKHNEVSESEKMAVAKETKPNNQSKEEVEQAEIINNFLKKLLEDERTRAAASTFIEYVSNSVEDEELKTMVQAIKSESLDPVVRTKINVRGSNRQKPIIEDEESAIEEEPVVQREKPKTGRHKSELDLLHDDIRNMFIKDGLLTSTGQRMCVLLKNDTTRTTAVRFDCKDPANWKTLKYMKSAYVSIPMLTLDSPINDVKIVISPMSIDPSREETNDGRYSLREIKKGSVNYLEIDSEDENKRRKRPRLEEEEKERYPLRLISKPLYREESSDDEMKLHKEKRRTSHKDKDSGEAKQVSLLKIDVINETSTNEANCSSPSISKKINYKKRGKAWASGVIPKKKKSKPTIIAETTTTTFIEPDKKYYFRTSMRSTALCKLCDKQVRNVTLHYRVEHPDSEVLSSRLSPKIAEHAVQESVRLNLDGLPDEPVAHNFSCLFKCRFCDSSLTGTMTDFQGHISTHTGEYMYECEHCLFATGNRKHLQQHYKGKHNRFFDKTIKPRVTRVYGYLCIDCNYVQMDRKAVEDHVNIYHLEEGKKIMKIYLSYFDRMKKTNLAQRSKPCPLSVKKKMEEAKQLEMEQSRIEPEEVEQQKRDQSPVQKPKRRYFQKSSGSVKRKTEENSGEPVKKRIDVTDSTIRRAMKEKTAVENRPQISRSEPEKENASKDVELNLGRDSVENMIQKLTDMLGDQTNSAEDRKELLLNLDKETTVLNAGFLSVVKDITGVEYICKLPFCSYKCRERETFVDHWKLGHSDVNRKYRKSVCQICQSDITASSDNSLLLKFFDHVEEDHLGLRRKDSSNQDSVSDVLNLLKTYLDKVSSNETRVEVKQEESSVKTESQGVQEMPSQPSEPCKDKSETTEVKKESVVEPRPPVKKEAEKSVSKSQYEWMSFGFLDVLKDNTSLEYVCRLPNCTFTTKETSKFLGHWNEDHDVVRNIHKIVTCLGCQKIVTAARNQNILTLFFEHVKKEHLDKTVETVENKPKEPFNEVVCIDSDSDEEAANEHGKTPESPKTIDETKNTSPTVKSSTSSTSKDELVLNFQYLRVVITNDGIMYQCKVDKDNCSMQTVIRERILDHWQQNHPIGEVKCTTCSQSQPDLTSLFVHIEQEHLNKIPVPKKSCSIPFTFKIAEVKSLAESPKPSSDPIKVKPLSSLTAEEPPQPDTSMAFKIAEVRSLADDKPKTAKVRSRATPPPLRQYPVKAKNPEDKSAAALSVFLNNPNMLYKCPKYDCQFFTDDKNLFSGHIAKHNQYRDEIVRCVYCSLNTSLSKIVTHIDQHHSKCRFSCSKCLYRAVLKEYVVVHMKQKHKGDVKVLRLKTNGEQTKTSDRRMSVSQACHPFRCGHADCGSEFLYQSEYYFHLDNFHGGYMTCGFKDANGVCQYKSVVADRMIDHWKIHNCHSFHCLKCKAGSTNLYAMLEHYSLTHPNSEPAVVDRRVAPRGGKVWGYSADACIGIKFVNDEMLTCVEPGTYTVEDPLSLTIEIESSDEEETEELSEEALMKKYGKLCPPVGKELKCPLCLEFTTKKPSYFVYHLLVELKCDRFKCNTCNYSCIPLDTMLAHCQEEHNNVITAGLTEIPINKKVEYWIQMVLKHQSKVILDKGVTPDGKDVQSQFFNTQCDFCQKWFRSIDLLNEHELCHWAEMTFGCGRCGEARMPSLDEVFRHCARAHPNEECLVTANAPSLIIPTWKSFPSKVTKEKAKAESSASQSPEVFYGCLQCSHVAVANVEMLKKHQVECHGGDGKDFRCRILKKSEVEVRLMLCLTK